MKTETGFIVATAFMAVVAVSSCSDPPHYEKAQENMSSYTHTFTTPEDAVTSLFRAYQSLDIESMVAAKDFGLDSRLFWEDLGLPVTATQMRKSIPAFESNFRKQMEEDGIPDYREATYAISGKDNLQPNFVVLTVVIRWKNGDFTELRIPTFQQDQMWKVVLAPGYGHL